jgi:site-specific DNA-methyltransferase (adenine-specific)
MSTARKRASKRGPDDDLDVIQFDETVNLRHRVNGIDQPHDTIAGMQDLVDKSVDLIIADPPYCIDLAEWDMKDSPVCQVDFATAWITQCARVLKPGGNMLLWGSSMNDWLMTQHAIVSKTGLQFMQSIVWQYPGFNRSSNSKLWNASDICYWYVKGPIPAVVSPISCRGFAYTEPMYFQNNPRILVSSFKQKNKKELHGCIYNVISFPRELPTFRGMCNLVGSHPSMKPIGLCEQLITTFTQSPGDVVLVPFAGSGSELIAAAMHNRLAIGFERDPDYIKLIQCRLDAMSDFVQNNGFTQDPRWINEHSKQISAKRVFKKQKIAL